MLVLLIELEILRGEIGIRKNIYSEFYIIFLNLRYFEIFIWESLLFGLMIWVGWCFLRYFFVLKEIKFFLLIGFGLSFMCFLKCSLVEVYGVF